MQQAKILILVRPDNIAVVVGGGGGGGGGSVCVSVCVCVCLCLCLCGLCITESITLNITEAVLKYCCTEI